MQVDLHSHCAFMELQLIVIFVLVFVFFFVVVVFVLFACFFFPLRDLSIALKCAFEIDFGLNRTNFLNSLI